MATKKKIETEKTEAALVTIYIVESYFDKKLSRNVYRGENIDVDEKRAAELVGKGLAKQFYGEAALCSKM